MKLTCVVSVLCLLKYQNVFGSEPICSRFDYEEKLLKKLVEMDATMSRMQDRLTELEDNVAACKCGVQGVAFYAYLSANVCPGVHQILVFDVLVTNVGKAYNAHDGAFVVPVNGTYAFAVSLFSQGKKYVGVEIVVNGDVKGEVFADSQEINDVHSSSASVVVDVNVGDHVYVRRGADSTCGILSQASRGRTYFSGWLLKY
ncbi:complement C1q-like protein 4 [Mya arenaria]|uniref:complement C1q-like protein 4 n=1 Tax=Mya arenaria TaxID=6604 RepID=UPI0022E8592B|nr:complement C1q-like protein 4 [Mya arenaria]